MKQTSSLRRREILLASLVPWAAPVRAQGNEILIGQTMPYSGPASSYSVIGKAEAAYFEMVNAQGGVNGRRIKLLSLDDAYSPPKAVEQTRRLVEQDKVLAIFGTFGTPTNAVIRKYLNNAKVPHLFPTGGAVQWDDPKGSPYTFGWQPNYNSEMKIYAAHVLQERPNAKIGILYQNDDVGKDNLKGLREGLGANAAKMLVKEVSYEITDATVESQVISLKEAGADVFFNTAAGKFCAQGIRKAAELGWKPMQFVSNYSSSVAAVMKPAGLEASKGVISTQFQKDPTDPKWKDDADFKAWSAWMDKYLPGGDRSDIFNVYGYLSAMTLVEVLKLAGPNVTREGLRAAAEKLKNVSLPMLLPGIVLNTSPTSHVAIKQLYMMRFDGASWQTFGGAKG